MDRRKLERLQSEIDDLRQRRGVRARELERLARKLGRERHTRGKEPTWVNPFLSDARPISIPSHPGDLNRYTARAILDQLEEDVNMLEVILDPED